MSVQIKQLEARETLLNMTEVLHPLWPALVLIAGGKEI